MSNLAQVGGLIAVPVVITIISAALSVRRRPGRYVMSAVQHFAAGVVLAAVAGEVLPALREEGHIVWAVLGFGLGIVLVIALEYVGEREAAAVVPIAGGQARTPATDGEARTPGTDGEGRTPGTDGEGRTPGTDGEGRSPGTDGEGRSPAAEGRADATPDESATATRVGTAVAAALPMGMLIPVAVDLLMDGVLVGMGASLGFGQALILTIALTIEVLFLGVSLTASLREAGQSPGRAVGVVAIVALSMAVGALGGVLLLAGASPQVMAAALAFGAAALLYLAVEELIVEAHENAETPWLTALFFVGFLVIYVLGEVAG